MDEDRRDTRRPGRRYEDAAMRELVRELLHDEGYVTMGDVEREFVPRNEHHQGAVDRRQDLMVKVAIASLILGPLAQVVITSLR